MLPVYYTAPAVSSSLLDLWCVVQKLSVKPEEGNKTGLVPLNQIHYTRKFPPLSNPSYNHGKLLHCEQNDSQNTALCYARGQTLNR